MRKHGALPGNKPNPAWTKRTAKRRRRNTEAKASRRKNRSG